MADRVESSSHTMGQQDAAEKSRPSMNATGERSAVAELVDAVQSAAESLLQEQKKRIADRISGMAEALEGAAHALNQSKNQVIGQYIQEAGQQVRTVSVALKEPRWNELIADVEDFARRQPIWFVLGGLTVGFMVGRFLWTAATAPSHGTNATGEGFRRETTRDVTAAISSAPGADETSKRTSAPAVGSPV
jgi:cell division septum initiation protein DivIVA